MVRVVQKPSYISLVCAPTLVLVGFVHHVLPVDRRHGRCTIFDIVVESQSGKMEVLNMTKYSIYRHFA